MATQEQFNERRERQNRYFSESFKRKKVREIERNISSVREVSKEYEVSTTAVYKWLHKFSRHYQRQVKQVIEPMSDTRKIKELKAQIKELERLVGQKQIQIEFQGKMIEIAEETYGLDIKKKFGSSRSSGSGNSEKSTTGK